MTKKIFIFLAALFLIAGNADAVLKEKDLARTLGVLRAELEKDWNKQQQFIEQYEQQDIQQHQQLVNYMTQCEQISLMLFSQSTDNTFDMAYACNQATQLHTEINKEGLDNLPYDRVIQYLKLEIERMEALIKSLKSIPPIIDDGTVPVTAIDSILHLATDSLINNVDSLADDSVVADEVLAEDLYILSGQPLMDRDVCLDLAEKMYKNMYDFLVKFETEKKYYESVQEKVNTLYPFAQSRYKVLQDNIFKTGTDNYISLLLTLPSEMEYLKNSLSNKYNPFEDKEATFSEWRGLSLMYLLGFVFLWFPVSLLVSYIFLRWFMPKRWSGTEYKYKRRMLNNILGIALFGIFVMIVGTIYDKNSFHMGAQLLINQCWLMGVAFLSLYIRLKDEQMVRGLKMYLPIIIMAFIIILFRIVLVPNLIVNLLCPPLLLAFSIWQLVESRRSSKDLPVMDKLYAYVTTTMMFICCIMSWVGYSFFAVQILTWWTFQLAWILTISCLYVILDYTEINLVVRYINPSLVARYKAGENVDKEYKALKRDMEEGKYITQTWFYDFMKRAFLPILSVGSILYCIAWAAEVFDLLGLCYKAFLYNFLDMEDVIQLSVYKLCLVVAMFYLFRWVNYTTRNMYIHYRTKYSDSEANINYTLSKNVIGILIWGLYIVISLIILKVPSSGISIITAGLATGLGFAMQRILENFFYGISLMNGRLSVGDYIECDGIRGLVDSITYQSVQIKTKSGSVISFLNSQLFNKNFKNLTKTNRYEKLKVPVNVAYGTDVKVVRQVLIDALNPMREMMIKDVPLLEPGKDIFVGFSGFGDNSVDLLVVANTLVDKRGMAFGLFNETIYETLNEHNIQIPFPQRDIHIISE